jgi:hypothetical protein
MGIKIAGYLIQPTEPDTPHCWNWRIYGSKTGFRYPDGKLKPQPGTWELVKEFKLQKKANKIGFPSIELEATDRGEWRFYQLVALDVDGREIWHKDNDALILPHDLPSEYEPPFDIPTWLLWNLEFNGHIEPGQIEGRKSDTP